MLRTLAPPIQQKLRGYLPAETYFSDIARVYLGNPFFGLTDDELAHFSASVQDDPMAGLMVARERARRTATPRFNVFCMPKSGSSFLSAVLQEALELPAAPINGVGMGAVNSIFGMNSREQEVDEFALVKAILSSPKGFVTQNHTRYSMFLGLQMRQFGVTSFVTVRNILDCIVSFDDMLLRSRQAMGEDGWVRDAQFALPLDYQALDEATRYDLLARSFGVWLIAFYLSWKRCGRQDYIRPIMVRYEDHILDGGRLIALLTETIGLDPAQTERARRYMLNPDRRRSRLNVGVAGRGRERVPDAAVEFLLGYAKLFSREIDESEIAYLIR